MSWKPPTQALLRARGVRPTPRRVLLLDALRAFARPVSAEELHGRVKQADLVTVYRTLESFVAVRLVREVRFRDATTRYELAETHHHHHLVCTNCGTVDELPECDLHALEASVLKRSKKFRSLEDHALEFFGTCVSCAKA